MINIENFLETGYYFGDVSEIFPDMSEYDQMCDKITKLDINDDSIWECQYVISTAQWSAPEEVLQKMYPHTVSLSAAKERYELVKQYNLETLSRTYSQKNPPTTVEVNEYFRKYCTEYAESIYRNKYATIQEYIQCYLEGDGLRWHTDSHNGTDCTLILYLSNDYWDNSGGELKILDRDDSCIPVRGKFSILDLTKNDVMHAVTPVVGNFRRFSYLFRPSVN